MPHLQQRVSYSIYAKQISINFEAFFAIFAHRVTRRSLKSHILVMHENKKPVFKKNLICEVCGTGFSAPSKLAHHAISHLDRETSKMQCDECGKWLKNQIMLRKHKLTHVHMPIECPHCPKVKFNKDALRSHIAQCHSTPKHHCAICNKSYLRRKLLEVIMTRSIFDSRHIQQSLPFCSLQAHIATHTSKNA